MDDLDMVDWNKFEHDSGEPWATLYDPSLRYHENFQAVLRRYVALEEFDVVAPIITAYAIANSKAAKVMPVLAIYGQSGSGKSRIGNLIASWRNQKENVIGSSTTFAAIRNLLQRLRWKHFDDSELDTSLNNERPYILIWADIKESNYTRDDGKIFALFRNGTNRSEEKIYISAGDGENIPFFVFGQKVISTTETFFLKPEWEELYRRCIFVPTTQFSKLPKSDLIAWQEVEEIDIDSYSFDGIEALYYKHWHTERVTDLMKLHKQRQSISKRLDKLGVTSHRQEMSLPLIYQGIASDIWSNAIDACEAFAQYWEYVSNRFTSKKTVLTLLLERLIEDQCGYAGQINEQLVRAGREDLVTEISIDTKVIKSSVTQAIADGSLTTVKANEIAGVMESLGWEIRQSTKGFHWYKR